MIREATMDEINDARTVGMAIAIGFSVKLRRTNPPLSSITCAIVFIFADTVA